MDAKVRYEFSLDIVASITRDYRSLVSHHLENLTDAHWQATGKMGYIYDGKGYASKPMRVFDLGMKPFGLTLGPLSVSLVDQHLGWLTGYSSYQEAFKKLSQGVLSLLAKAKTAQELRDMLPDLSYRNLSPTHTLAQLPRATHDLYAAQLDNAQTHWDSRLVTQYAGIASLVDTFNGYSLLCAS